jgi:hypothetical protein
MVTFGSLARTGQVAKPQHITLKCRPVAPAPASPQFFQMGDLTKSLNSGRTLLIVAVPGASQGTLGTLDVNDGSYYEASPSCLQLLSRHRLPYVPQQNDLVMNQYGNYFVVGCDSPDEDGDYWGYGPTIGHYYFKLDDVEPVHRS